TARIIDRARQPAEPAANARPDAPQGRGRARALSRRCAAGSAGGYNRLDDRQLAVATANIGVATADLYPKFSVTGALGDESQSLKSIFDWESREYQIVPGVSWDIFNAGKVESNIQVQNARQAEALQAYRKAVLQSLSDVDDALVAFNREQVRLEALRGAVAANQKAVDLSTELFEKGSTDFLYVLDAQRSLFAAQDSMVQSEQQVTVDL